MFRNVSKKCLKTAQIENITADFLIRNTSTPSYFDLNTFGCKLTNIEFFEFWRFESGYFESGPSTGFLRYVLFLNRK